MNGRWTAVLALLALGAAGCGAGDRVPGSSTAAKLSAGAQHKHARHSGATGQVLVSIVQLAPGSLSRHPLAAIPSSQSVFTRGAGLSVVVRSVIDPLEGSGAVLQKGTRAVAVVVQIENAGPAVYDSSATGDFTVVTSSGPVTPLFAKRGVCKTPVDDFDRYITAGEDRVGCVAFAIPIGATVTEVRFSPHAQAKGRLVWAG